jgi:hypothetical protein
VSSLTGAWQSVGHNRVPQAHAPSNKAFKLTRSHWSVCAWRHFVPPCDGHGGPSQLNAMFCGHHESPIGRSE